MTLYVIQNSMHGSIRKPVKDKTTVTVVLCVLILIPLYYYPS